jgi:hypothetical protein
MPRAADQAVDRVGRREGLAQAIGQVEREHGERLVEAFTDARRGTRRAILESSYQILEQAARGRNLRLLVGPGDRADPWTLPLRQMLQDVSQLVHVTAVNQRGRTKRLRHRFVQRLRAVEDDQEAAVGTRPTALQIGEEALTHRRILRRAVPEAQRVVAAGVVNAERDHDTAVADVDAIDQQRHELHRIERERPPGGEPRRSSRRTCD